MNAHLQQGTRQVRHQELPQLLLACWLSPWCAERVQYHAVNQHYQYTGVSVVRAHK
jgi:hypothetical protein